MNADAWKCLCTNYSSVKMSQCRNCGRTRPTEFEVEVDGKKTIVGRNPDPLIRSTLGDQKPRE